MIELYRLEKNNNLTTTQENVKLSGGSSDVTWTVEIDFTALGIDDLRQCWLTFAPELADGADYADTDWDITFSNWTVTDPSGNRPLKIAHPKKPTRVGSQNTWITYGGTGWTAQNGFYHLGFARRSQTANDTITIRYANQFTHDLYGGTALSTDRGIVDVQLDSDTAAELDTCLNVDVPLVTRRKVRTAVSAGTHTVTITVKGTKNASSTDHWCELMPLPDYEKLGSEVGRLVAEKQVAYGDSFGKSGGGMRILYPDGIGLDQLEDALVVIRIIDKLCRVATDRDTLGKNPFRDIGGNSRLAIVRITLVQISFRVSG